LIASSALVACTGVAGAFVLNGVRFTERFQVAPGVEYREFSIPSAQGVVYGHLLIADLSNRRVSVDLLHPDAVAGRETVSQMANDQGAVGGVNGDFFDVNEKQHPGVDVTGAAVGPAIAAGEELKAAVPRGQRFGPSLPTGASDQDVIGVGIDRVARIDRLSMNGSVTTPQGTLDLRGLNQYALPVGGIGAYTSRWGRTSRYRAVCGTDHRRADSCSMDTYEVTVTHGRIVSVSETPGGGAIPRDTIVLVGREAGARALRRLRVGDAVHVTHRLTGGTDRAPGPLVMAGFSISRDGTTTSPIALAMQNLILHEEASVERQADAAQHPPLRFAIGGLPILRGGKPVPGLDDSAHAVRTSAGYGLGGHLFYLMALDGDPHARSRLTLRELAGLMRNIGSQDAVDLDGGGSSTLVVRNPGSDHVSVRNHPSGGSERPVADGVGIFVHQ
jgi:hypothetical protein